METNPSQPIQQSRLPKLLTTVTPFSKILAMFLFIALPFVGFYLGMKYQEKVTVTTTATLNVQKVVRLTPTPSLTTTITPTPTPNQISCSTDKDCQNGATCEVVGPLQANKPIRKVCVPKGQMIPL